MAVKPGEAAALVRGRAGSFREGLRKGAEVVTESQAAKQARLGKAAELGFDVPIKEFSGGPANPMNWPTRTLAAEDVVQREMARGAARAQLRVNPALAKGLKGGAEQYIEDFAAKAVFQQEPLKLFQMGIDGKRAIAMLKEEAAKKGNWVDAGLAWAGEQLATMAIPFIKTTSNVARVGLEYSPIGLARGLSRAVKTPDRRAAELVSSGLLGLPFFVAAKYATGHLMGQGPEDTGHREELLKRGIVPNSIKIKDTVIPLRLFGGLGTALSAAATMMERWQDEMTRTGGQADLEAIAMSGIRGLDALASETAMGDFALITSALQDPERYFNLSSRRIAQGMVPFSALSRTVTATVDPTKRRPEAGNLAQYMQQIVPGMSQKLEPRIDIYGQPERQASLGEDTPLGRLLRGVTGVATTKPEDPMTARLLALEQERGIGGALPGYSPGKQPAWEQQIRGQRRREALDVLMQMRPEDLRQIPTRAELAALLGVEVEMLEGMSLPTLESLLRRLQASASRQAGAEVRARRLQETPQ